MIPLVRFLALHGPLLLLGVTALLTAGAVAMRLQCSPIHRQRIGELTIGCTLLWIVLACVPLPRMFAPDTAPPAPEPIRPSYRLPAHAAPALRMPGPASERPAPLYLATDVPGTTPSLAEWGEFLATADRTHSVVATDSAHDIAPSVAATMAERFTDPAPPARIDRRNLAAVAFVSGAAACAAWLALGRLMLFHLFRHASAPPAWLQDQFNALAGGGPAVPRLLVSRQCGRPISCGMFFPAILLPADAVSPANHAQLRQVLLHELAHVRQRDAWGNALFNLALPVLYFHPLYWLARRDVHLARELVADDWAAARSGKARYVAELVALARSALERGRAPAGPWGSMGLFRSPTHFYRRMHMLLQRNEPLDTSCSRTWRFGTAALCAAGVVVAAAAVGLEPARAQDTPGNDEGTATSSADAAPAAGLPADPTATVSADAPATTTITIDPSAAPSADAAPSAGLPSQTSSSAPSADVRNRGPLAGTSYDLRATAPRAENDDVIQPRTVTVRTAQNNRIIDVSHSLADARRALADATRRLQAVQSQPAGEHQRGDARVAELQAHIAKLQSELDRLAEIQFDPNAVQPATESQVARVRQSIQQPSAGMGLATQSGADNIGMPELQASQRGAGLRGGAGQIDLVTLAVNFVDAAGDARTARSRLDAAAKLRPNDIGRLELAEMEAGLETAMRKVQLLRGLIDISLNAARSEYKYAIEMSDQGLVPQSQVVEAKQKLEILQLIAKSGEGRDGAQGKDRAGY